MNTLLLCLAGPMQSWGTQSRFTDRDTGREPSKSGVVGLLCAALGRDRAEPLDDLASLRFGVRVDREGVFQTDYHTALKVAIAGNPSKTRTVVSHRHYLADASFLAGFEGSDEQLGLLERLDLALANPVWLLYLGRKSFVPSLPVRLGLRCGVTLEEALGSDPPLPGASPHDGSFRTVVEVKSEYQEGIRYDQPLSFLTRSFLPRTIRFGLLPAPATSEVPS
jgi:CRISPR system Cascade subunit CasD